MRSPPFTRGPIPAPAMRLCCSLAALLCSLAPLLCSLAPLLCSLAPLLCSLAPLASQAARPPIEQVLARWARAYAKGRIDLDGLAVAKGRVDPVYGHDWLGPQRNADQTHRAALVTLLERAVGRPTPAAVEQVVRLASLGMVDGSASFTRTHAGVRHLAALALPKFTSPACVLVLLQTAGGDFGRWSKTPVDRLGPRAAAILGLGAMGLTVVRPILQRQLRDPDALVRLASAEALGSMAHPQALPMLAAAMQTETDSRVAQACVKAVDRTLAGGASEVSTGALREVLIAAIAALGRTDWRSDLAIVALLGRVRSALAVEPLIGILERFVGDRSGGGGASAPAGEPSRRLQLAAHDTLRSLTGAILAIDRPDLWRAFWAAEQDRFVVAPPKDLAPTRTVAGFFGVPVRGSNVLFIIDTSGSMAAGFMPAGEYIPTPADDGLTRLEMARRELLKAVDGLSGDAKFNLVSFASEVQLWRRELVRASGKARGALRRRVHKLVPGGGTNIFGALQAGLEIKTLAYGARYGTSVDEVFLLSAGEPTVGEVIATEAILEVIRESNRYSSVRINTLYMGGGGDSRFMRRLAEENGGAYVRL